MLSVLIARCLRRPAPAPAPAGRLEVCPPALATMAQPPWRRLWRWLSGPRAGAAELRQIHRVGEVREEFERSVADIGHSSAGLLMRHIGEARSLRDLWHLRPEVYDLVSRFRSQDEAERRLARLNRHFPTRSARSGFMPLND